MDKWLEYWQQDELMPDVFTDKHGNKHHGLEEFWHKHFASFTEGSRVIDIASGAGAVYRCIEHIQRFDAHALDISNEALAILKTDLPSVKIHPCMLDANTLSNTGFDAVVSQFGIEYLGFDGFKQAARLLKPGGRCVFLSHIKDGAIDNVTQRSLNGLLLIRDNAFLALAKSVADAFNKDEKTLVERCVNSFMKVEPSIAEYCKNVPDGHHVHLYEGIKQLLSNYNQYEHKTVVAWIEQANTQAMENIERLESMHNAALSQQQLDELTEQLLEHQLEITQMRPFKLRKEDAPVAWEIVGVKQR
jgi:ubiquinone/menaquinone biosynthesis C-methylase UbiE